MSTSSERPPEAEPSADEIPCRLCGGPSAQRFRKTILRTHDVGFYECRECGSLQSEEPYWLEESYSDGRRVLDTSAALRAQKLQALTWFVAKSFGLDASHPVLDWGAGDGLFVRMLRDAGLDAHHWDPYSENLYAAGFEGDRESRYAMITAYEVWEHLPNPGEELAKIFAIGPRIHMATTGLYTGQGPEWDYLNPLTGRHVFFYSRRAVDRLARDAGYQVEVFGNKLLLFYRDPPSRLRLGVLRRLLARQHSRIHPALYALLRPAGLGPRDYRQMSEEVAAGKVWEGRRGDP